MRHFGNDQRESPRGLPSREGRSLRSRKKNRNRRFGEEESRQGIGEGRGEGVFKIGILYGKLFSHKGPTKSHPKSLKRKEKASEGIGSEKIN